ncbi:hypothetical protein EYR41_006115 [Orbilia oligospora]|uniref:Uncharacterized protein n=1 Tax=Orbilia oligospora TaxID=2813651 RepID=A0A8H2E040_ORBOL|nr:hypothetical protein EYR41_006115 [Orbilia oligospora]
MATKKNVDLNDKRVQKYLASLNPNMKELANTIFCSDLTDERKARFEAETTAYKEIRKLAKEEVKVRVGATLETTWLAMRNTVIGVHIAYTITHSLPLFQKGEYIDHEHLTRILDSISAQKIFRNQASYPEPFQPFAFWLWTNHLEGSRKTVGGSKD